MSLATVGTFTFATTIQPVVRIEPVITGPIWYNMTDGHFESLTKHIVYVLTHGNLLGARQFVCAADVLIKLRTLFSSCSAVAFTSRRLSSARTHT